MSKNNKIESIAKQILVNYDITDIPVDPVKIANIIGINVYKTEFSSFESDTISGSIEKQGNLTEILVNKNDNINRQRFTIAHELGHYFLHLSDCDSCEKVDMHRITGYTSNIPEEVEANQFAAAILMPEEAVLYHYNEIKNIGFSGSYIAELLSNIFCVSNSAMNYRLKDLGIF